MKRVKISELQAHLSDYIAAARRGETVIVCDRDTPVAKLEPLDDELTIRKPTLPLEALKALRPVKLDASDAEGPNDDWIREPNLTEEERREILSKIKPVALLKDVDVQAIHAEMRDERF